MNFKTVVIKTSAVLYVEDRLTIDTDVRQIVAQVEKLIDDGQVRIVLHFTDDSYLCTRSVAAILQCNRLVTAHKGRLGILAPNSEILESIETTGIDRFVKVYKSEDNIE